MIGLPFQRLELLDRVSENPFLSVLLRLPFLYTKEGLGLGLGLLLLAFLEIEEGMEEKKVSMLRCMKQPLELVGLSPRNPSPLCL